MKHVSRTHRVALDWLFGRTNLDLKIQIQYVDTTKQLAALLTEGSFTRDEWCKLLCLADIMNLSMFSRRHFRSVEEATTMSKRIQRKKEKGRRNCGSKAEVSVFDFSKGVAGNCTNLDVMQEKRVHDYWNVDGDRTLSDSWTRFTKFTLLNEKPLPGYMWSGGAPDKDPRNHWTILFVA